MDIPGPLSDWNDLALNSVDRKGLQHLILSVLYKNPEGIARVLGRALKSPFQAVEALDRLTPQPFIKAVMDATRLAIDQNMPLSLPDIYLRGMSRSLAQMNIDGVDKGTALAHLVPGVRVDRFQGGSGVIGDLFSAATVQRIEGWLDAAYLGGEVQYPKYNRILKKRLPKELESPQITWSTIWVEDELAAIAKCTADAFFGTHYVHKKFQSGYGFGSIVRSSALGNTLSSGNLIYGHVAPHNPALARHFRVDRLAMHTASLGIGLTREKDEEGESEDLLETVIAAKLCGFQTVHETRHPDALVDSWGAGEPLPTDSRTQGRLSVYAADALKGDHLIETLRREFEDDRILTRRTKGAWLFEDRYLPRPFLDGRIYWDAQQRMNEESTFGGGFVHRKRSKA
jgi:hypothetical protein